MEGKVKINYNLKETTMEDLAHGSFFIFRYVLYQRIQPVTTKGNVDLNCINVELGELKFINWEAIVAVVDVEIDIK